MKVFTMISEQPQVAV